MKREDEKQKHPTEVAYPEQCEEYQKIIQEMYKLHLAKNREYSPNNIKAIGLLGCALRLFEKNIRLLNLLGWDPWKGEMKEKITDPKFGSVDAELDDLANISILMKLLLRGKWAR